MDYDVGVLGLSSPPSSAVVTSYRPAVSVRNNGIHDAIASGYLRIYAAGLLIFETEIYSGTLAPGVTGTADAVDYWTPPAEDTYIINGYVTTPLDQVEPNNNLAPVTIIVKGGPVPPEPEVPLHAAQHEEGGTDPINVDGLPGLLADRQLPYPHASQHQIGGSDALNVGSLQGILAQDQPTQVHSNTKHNPDMALASDLTALTSETTHLTKHIQSLHGDPITVPRGTTSVIFQHTFDNNTLSLDQVIRIEGYIRTRCPSPNSPVIHLDIREGSASYTVDVSTLSLLIDVPAWPVQWCWRFLAILYPWSDGGYHRLNSQITGLASLVSGEVRAGYGAHAENTIDLTHAIGIRLRLSIPDIPDAEGYAGPIDMTLLGTPHE